MLFLRPFSDTPLPEGIQGGGFLLLRSHRAVTPPPTQKFIRGGLFLLRGSHGEAGYTPDQRGKAEATVSEIGRAIARVRKL